MRINSIGITLMLHVKKLVEKTTVDKFVSDYRLVSPKKRASCAIDPRFVFEALSVHKILVWFMIHNSGNL